MKYKIFKPTIVKNLTGGECYVFGEDGNNKIEGYNGIGKGYGKIGQNDRKSSHILFFLFPDKAAYPVGYFRTKLHRDVAAQFVLLGSKTNKSVVLDKTYYMGSYYIDDILTDVKANNITLESLTSPISDEALRDFIKTYNKPWLTVQDIREVAKTNRSLITWTSAQTKAFYAFVAMITESPFVEWNSMDVAYILHFINENTQY